MPEPAVGLAVTLTGALLGELVASCVGDGRAAGALEHPVTKAAEITMRTAITPFPITQLVPSASPPRRQGPRGLGPRSGARSESLLAHSSSGRYNCLASRGHGDAWFRQGRQTDRREPRNAVPPR